MKILKVDKEKVQIEFKKEDISETTDPKLRSVISLMDNLEKDNDKPIGFKKE